MIQGHSGTAAHTPKITGRVGALAGFVLAAAAFLSSCAPRATVSVPVSAADPAGILFGATLSPASESLIRKLSGAGGAGGSAAGTAVSVFDAPGISASLKAAGIGAQSVTAEGASLAVSALVPKADGFLNGAVSVNPGQRLFRISVNRQTVAAAIGLMPVSTRDYLDLLMAPVFTGETMSAGEYRDLIGAAYGKTIATELSAARFTLTVKAPSPVKAATIAAADGNAGAAGTAADSGSVKTAGNEAIFNIPLITLLTLESPLTVEVGW